MLAKLVRELRDKTGAGFLDCKKALLESNHNIDVAVEWLRKKGIARATKKLDNIAAEGVVKTVTSDTHAVIFELNAQTDFVAQNDEFQTLASQIANALLNNDFNTISEACKLKINNATVDDLIIMASARIGEKINLRRAERITIGNNTVGAYTHVNNRVAAIVVATGGKPEKIRNVAMHVASMNPHFLDANSVPAKQLKALKAEVLASPVLKGKPEQVKNSIANGMLRKKLANLTLVDQEFVMEKMSVLEYLKQNNAVAIRMLRYELGDGIEKAKTSFGDEVAKQIR